MLAPMTALNTQHGLLVGSNAHHTGTHAIEGHHTRGCWAHLMRRCGLSAHSGCMDYGTKICVSVTVVLRNMYGIVR